jgi:hypothetical protein
VRVASRPDRGSDHPVGHAVTERWCCGKCLMSFLVKEATRSKCERMRCPDCGLGFWSTHDGKSRHCVVGVSPKELEAC